MLRNDLECSSVSFNLCHASLKTTPIFCDQLFDTWKVFEKSYKQSFFTITLHSYFLKLKVTMDSGRNTFPHIICGQNKSPDVILISCLSGACIYFLEDTSSNRILQKSLWVSTRNTDLYFPIFILMVHTGGFRSRKINCHRCQRFEQTWVHSEISEQL